MFTWNFQYLSKTKLKEAVEQLDIKDTHHDVLVRIHTAIHDEEEAVELAVYVKSLIPNAHIFGTSTSAVIYKGKLMTDQCIVSVTEMDKASVRTAVVPTFKNELPVPPDELCRAMGENVMQENTKLVLTFLTGKYMDVHWFIDRCNDYFPGVEMIGGLANTSDVSLKKFLQSGFVFNENGWSSESAIFASISGDVESVTSYATGVEAVGEDMEITDSFGSCILELDGEDAAKVYRRGVGDALKSDPELTNLFPYVYSNVSDIPVFVRYSNDESLKDQFSENIPKNKRFYDAHPNLDTNEKRELINANHNVIKGKKIKRAFIYDKKI